MPPMNNQLAARVAALARLLRDAIMQAWPGDDGAADLCRLLPDMTPEQCTDMIAQMACCALFAAYSHRNADVPFTRTDLASHVSVNQPFLRAMFSYLANPDLDERVACVVDRLIETLNGVDFDVINDHTTSRDALSYFYETFLAVYDAALRGRRGVYYTPEPIVSYMVRGVDHLLRTDFAMPDGLADVASHILDPAVGTGAFLSGLIAHIHHSFKGAAGQWQDYVAQNLLPRLSGYELLAAPYAIAHLQLTLQLAETGYDFRAGDNLHLSLANALEHESGADAAPSPLVVIVGNPPYAGHSANDGAWIAALLHGCDQRTGQRADSYFEVDGVPISERNVKWLNDDYVKFMRYAQWRIERAGAGILAFVTNHGYLENPTFRGMRRALMQSFDAIYALDLHGNSKKNARAPGNTRDENVFDIRQGIAISIFVRHMSPGADQTREAKVYHADLWGLRADKYRWLAMHDCATTPWAIVEPAPPFYLFVPQDVERRAEYERGWPITAIMPVNSLGLLTKRDALVVGFNQQELLQKIAIFADPGRSDVECAAQFGVPLRDKDTWDIARARTAVRDQISAAAVMSIAYRPLDTRSVYYDESLIARRNTRVMQHLGRPNRALVLGRQGETTGADTWDVFFAVATLADQNIFRRGGGTVFPLYLYDDMVSAGPPGQGQGQTGVRMPGQGQAQTGVRMPGQGQAQPLPYTDGTLPRSSNLSSAFIDALSAALAMHFVADGKGDLYATFGPEDVFDYLYAVLHAPTYRARYADFLKIDFPRVPLPESADLFRALCPLGARLVALHLMEQSGGALPAYPIAGDNSVDRVAYQHGRVYINAAQYFGNVPPDAWVYHVGGYQLCHKWLKDRKGRTLSYADIEHYRRIVAILAETITVIEQIDEIQVLYR